MTSYCTTDSAGNKHWCQNDGRLHRDDGPAIELATGGVEWWINGECHRDGAHAVETAGGSKFWFQTGNLHRTYGPAIEYAGGDKYWYQNGKKHRDDGPAIEWNDGDIDWYINNVELTPAEFAAKMLDKETAILWKMSGYCWPFDFGDSK